MKYDYVKSVVIAIQIGVKKARREEETQIFIFSSL
jgi:hypothetical protein